MNTLLPIQRACAPVTARPGCSPAPRASAGSVLDSLPSATPEVERQHHDELTPLYNVVLLDDNTHTYDYVIEMLMQLFFMSQVDAFRHAVEVDTTGRTVVITCELVMAEFARDQIRSYGPDYRMPESKGSMSAIIEPTAG